MLRMPRKGLLPTKRKLTEEDRMMGETSENEIADDGDESSISEGEAAEDVLPPAAAPLPTPASEITRQWVKNVRQGPSSDMWLSLFDALSPTKVCLVAATPAEITRIDVPV
jgi:hypothetical protein